MAEANIAWILTASALVLLMTPGLAFFYGGLVREKNVVSTLMYSFVSMGVVSVIWVLWGYSLAFGGGNEFIGTFDFLGLQDISFESGPNGEIPDGLFVIFQMMFAIITPALITGAFAERFKFSTYLIFLVLWITLVYVPVAHWVWAGEGWIFGIGAADFAGGDGCPHQRRYRSGCCRRSRGTKAQRRAWRRATQRSIRAARSRTPLVRLVRVQRRFRFGSRWPCRQCVPGHQHGRCGRWFDLGAC